MKSLFIAITIIASLFGSQEKSATVKVWGNCGMCKARIEKALKVEGVNKADWNTETKMLAVTYDNEQISLDKIQQTVANSGHDTEKFTAPDSIYAKLPGCCRYDRKEEKTDK